MAAESKVTPHLSGLATSIAKQALPFLALDSLVFTSSLSMLLRCACPDCETVLQCKAECSLLPGIQQISSNQAQRIGQQEDNKVSA